MQEKVSYAVAFSDIKSFLHAFQNLSFLDKRPETFFGRLAE